MLDIWLHLKSGHLTADSYWQYSSGWQHNKYGRQEFSELLLPYSMCGSNEEDWVETEKQKRRFSFCSLRLTLYKWPLLNYVILVYICCAKFLVIYNPIKRSQVKYLKLTWLLIRAYFRFVNKRLFLIVSIFLSNKVPIHF